MLKPLSLTFTILLPTIGLLDLARAQESSFSAKPCVICELPKGRNYNPDYQYVTHPETLKGTCYYDKNGVIRYWIVRWWSDTSGQPSIDREGRKEKEFVGYPAALEEQKLYNQKIYNTLGGADFGPPPYGNCRTNGDLDYPAKYGPCWGGQPRWDLRMNVPRAFLETGELDADTVRIPLFKTGVALLHAQAMFHGLCVGVNVQHDQWKRVYADGVGDLCDAKENRPKNKTLDQYQSLLKAIGEELNTAQAAARRYEEIVEVYSVQRALYISSNESVNPGTPAAADQLAALQKSMEFHLRKADELDQVVEAYEKRFPELFNSNPIHSFRH